MAVLIPQIKSSKVIDTGNFQSMLEKFQNVVKNTKRFNGKFCKYSTKKVANGYQFYAHSANTGVLLLEWSLLGYRHGAELAVTTYKA